MAIEKLTLRQINRAYLARQLLLQRERMRAVEAIERLVGMQAQEPCPPFVGLWTRLEGFRRSELVAALHERAVVRATLMRATLHYLSAADYLTFRMTLQPMLTSAMSVLAERAERLDLDRVLPVASELLAEQPRTFDELRPLLAERFPEMNDRALGYSVRLHLPLVMVPTEHRWGYSARASFTLAGDWLGTPIPDRDARHELVLRYLAAFGPATVADAQAWSGMRGLRSVFEDLRPRLCVFTSERGRELFDLPDAPRPPAEVEAPVRFVAAFDNLLLAHAERSRIISEERRRMVFTKNGRILPTILVDGFVAGMWKIERGRDRAVLTVTPLETLPPGVTAPLRDEGAALVRFAEEDATDFDVRIAEPIAIP